MRNSRTVQPDEDGDDDISGGVSDLTVAEMLDDWRGRSAAWPGEAARLAAAAERWHADLMAAGGPPPRKARILTDRFRPGPGRYYGVRRLRGGKFAASLRIPARLTPHPAILRLGTFDTEGEAAVAVDAAAVDVYGGDALLNFPKRADGAATRTRRERVAPC